MNIHGCQPHPKVAIYVVKQLKNDSFRQGLQYLVSITLAMQLAIQLLAGLGCSHDRLGSQTLVDIMKYKSTVVFRTLGVPKVQRGSSLFQSIHVTKKVNLSIIIHSLHPSTQYCRILIHLMERKKKLSKYHRSKVVLIWQISL